MIKLTLINPDNDFKTEISNCLPKTGIEDWVEVKKNGFGGEEIVIWLSVVTSIAVQWAPIIEVLFSKKRNAEIEVEDENGKKIKVSSNEGLDKCKKVLDELHFD